jgi:hypothetical protein
LRKTAKYGKIVAGNKGGQAMVNSILGVTPYSYYDVVNPSGDAALPAFPAPDTSVPTPAPSSPIPGGSKLSSDTLAVLQQIVYEDTGPVASLIGGGTGGSGTSALLGGSPSEPAPGPDQTSLASLYRTLVTAAYQGTIARNNTLTAAYDPLTTILSNYEATKATTDIAALNKQVQRALDANAFAADGVTRLDT